MIQLKPLLNPEFWFALQPSTLTPTFERAFFLFFGLMVIIGAVARIMARHKKDDRLLLQVYRQIGRMFLTMGVLGMMIFFFTFEEIYFFGARFWFIAWGIGLIVWIAMIVSHAKKIPQMREEYSRAKEGDKYLPRKKGK
ncbi:MAG: hypothetical protein ABH846_02305 [Patescibacteria group bacterium]